MRVAQTDEERMNGGRHLQRCLPLTCARCPEGLQDQLGHLVLVGLVRQVGLGIAFPDGGPVHDQHLEAGDHRADDVEGGTGAVVVFGIEGDRGKTTDGRQVAAAGVDVGDELDADLIAVVTIVRLLDVGDQACVRVLLGHVIPGVEGLDVTVIEYQ